MKLDNEQVIQHSTIGYNTEPYSFLADAKSFENKEKPLDSTGLSADEIVKANQDGTVHDKKGGDQDSDFSPYMETPEDELTASVNGNEKEVGDFVTSNSHSSKNTDSVFYFDKSVTECQLPELVVCYKESTYHVVKDICIHKGVPTHDKFLFDSGVDEKSHCYFPQSEKDQYSKLEIDMPMHDFSLSPEENQFDIDCASNKEQGNYTSLQAVPLSLEENESNKGIPNQCDSEDLTMTREMKDDAMEMVTYDVSEELFTLGDILSLPELTTVRSEASSTNRETDGIEQQSFENARQSEVIVVSANNPSEEAILSTPDLVSAADSGKGEAMPISPARASASDEATNNSLVKEASDDSKLETGTITSDSGSSAPPTSKDDLKTGRALEGTSDQPFSSYLQRGYGESSFSAAGPVTGLISYSGPIAYSGNLSHRSDSSTTSTRSFAFPILQSEWNSSPVRMVKADRRQYRKNLGWKHCFLCCKF